jgi:hypothetical protein
MAFVLCVFATSLAGFPDYSAVVIRGSGILLPRGTHA